MQNSITRRKVSFFRMQKSYWSVTCLSFLVLHSSYSRQRIVHKIYSKMVPSEEDMENGKSKAPNLNRLIKARLEKLVSKSDETCVVPFFHSQCLLCSTMMWSGRVLSDEFMQLPSKKLWPFYYKEIKRPQCFENIFVRPIRSSPHTLSHWLYRNELNVRNMKLQAILLQMSNSCSPMHWRLIRMGLLSGKMPQLSE